MKLSDETRSAAKTLFMPAGWRQNLCKCEKCAKIYPEEKLEFLLSAEDTVHHYEEQSKKEKGRRTTFWCMHRV